MTRPADGVIATHSKILLQLDEHLQRIEVLEQRVRNLSRAIQNLRSS